MLWLSYIKEDRWSNNLYIVVHSTFAILSHPVRKSNEDFVLLKVSLLPVTFIMQLVLVTSTTRGFFFFSKPVSFELWIDTHNNVNAIVHVDMAKLPIQSGFNIGKQNLLFAIKYNNFFYPVGWSQ